VTKKISFIVLAPGRLWYLGDSVFRWELFPYFSRSFLGPEEWLGGPIRLGTRHSDDRAGGGYIFLSSSLIVELKRLLSQANQIFANNVYN
jgi:hypothetical protein